MLETRTASDEVWIFELVSIYIELNRNESILNVIVIAAIYVASAPERKCHSKRTLDVGSFFPRLRLLLAFP